MRELQAVPKDRRVEELRQIERRIGDFTVASSELPLDLLLAYRDASAWTEMVRCIEKMPADLRRVPPVKEQLAFALNRRNQANDRSRAAAILEELIAEHGASPETSGALGRVYKDTWEEALAGEETGRAQAALDAAIEHYSAGFDADPRDYYPGINALTLLVRRAGEGDLERAQELQPVILFAIGRRGGLGSRDYWDVATVLELAVIGGDRKLADQASGRIELLEPQDWMRETTAKNLGILGAALDRDHRDWIEALRRRLLRE
jgi:hypothetical protein